MAKTRRAGTKRRAATGATSRSGRGDAARDERAAALRQAVESVAMRLQHERRLRPGSIVFRAADGEPPVFTLRATDAAFAFETTAEHSEPLLEVIGDPGRIRAIVRGEKDARMQFFAGGIRVRGDMQYLSEL